MITVFQSGLQNNFAKIPLRGVLLNVLGPIALFCQSAIKMMMAK